jgi:tRNA threonylcarbamoyladenosine biosynthesis protein TsaE
LKGKDFTYGSASDQETITFGRKIASFLQEGDVVALVGELGSGKTWLTKGIALGLGVAPGIVITSPSFALVNEYEGRCPFYHMDVYRLGSLSEFIAAGLEEYLYSGGVVVMEWADRWPEILPDETLCVELLIMDDRRRKITLSGHHPRVMEIIKNMEKETCKR